MYQAFYEILKQMYFKIPHYEEVIKIIKRYFSITNDQIAMILQSSILGSYFAEICIIASKFIDIEYPVYDINTELPQAISYYSSLRYSQAKQKCIQEALFIFEVLFSKKQRQFSLCSMKG